MLTESQLRSPIDDLTIYQPYQSPIENSKDTSLRFLKVPNPHLPRMPKEDPTSFEENLSERRLPLRSLHDVGGYSAVFMPGQSPCLIIKSASSLPVVIDMCDSPVQTLTQLHSTSCQKGFLYVDGEVRRARLDVNQPSLTISRVYLVPLNSLQRASMRLAGLQEGFHLVKRSMPLHITRRWIPMYLGQAR